MEDAQAPAPTPAQHSKGKDQIYKAAARQFLSEANDYVTRVKQSHSAVSGMLNQNAHTARGYANAVISGYRDDFADRETALKEFFVERFEGPQSPSLTYLLSDMKVNVEVFKNVIDPTDSVESYDRIAKALSWIAYFEQLL